MFIDVKCERGRIFVGDSFLSLSLCFDFFFFCCSTTTSIQIGILPLTANHKFVFFFGMKLTMTLIVDDRNRNILSLFRLTNETIKKDPIDRQLNWKFKNKYQNSHEKVGKMWDDKIELSLHWFYPTAERERHTPFWKTKTKFVPQN